MVKKTAEGETTNVEALELFLEPPYKPSHLSFLCMHVPVICHSNENEDNTVFKCELGE